VKGPITLLAILALGGLLAFNFYLDQGGGAPGGPKWIEELSSAVMLPDTIQRAERSVYLVVGSNFTATAFLVDSKCGIFATNAHVADGVAESRDPVYVKQANTGKTFEIGSVKIHPARALFTKLVDEYGPFLDPSTVELQALPVPLAYDAALLYAKGITCEAPGELASLPDLKIASRESLVALKAGDPIALIGFQGHGTTTKDVEWLTVSPRIEVGHVRAIGSYIPTPAGDAAGSQRLKQMVLHTLSTTHGTSGSPMINHEGQVIAVNQGAASTGDEEDERVLERIGHRADIIAELMSGEESQLISEYKASIGEYLGRYTSATKMIAIKSEEVAHYLTTARDSRVNVALKTLEQKQAQFGAVVSGFVVPASEGAQAYAFGQRGRYFYGRAQLPAGKAYLLSALDYDQGVKFQDTLKVEYRRENNQDLYDFLCPIRISVRTQGTGSFVWGDTLQLAYLAISPAADARSIEYVIWRHPGCSAQSLSFDLGIAGYDVTPKTPNPALAFWEGVKSRIARGLSTLKDILRREALAG
jgi:S1-C subfamily serine protease